MKNKKEKSINYALWTQEQFEEEMKTKPQYQAFFKQYDAYWVEHFIKRHAEYKVEAMAKLEANQKFYNKPYNDIATLARKFLDEILQRKWFNQQCLWRAGEIDLPHIIFTFDFSFLERDIRNCPFIEPITEEELAIAIQFLKEQPYWTPYAFISWQNYETFKDNIDVEDNGDWNPERYPLFYEHFDQYDKTRYFWTLPDKRGEIEDNYRSVAYAEKQKDDEPKEEMGEISALKNLGDALSKRYLFYDTDVRDDFVDYCEDHQIKEVLAMDDNYFGYETGDIYFDDALNFLYSIDEEVPMVADDDWKKAIMDSVTFFKHRKMIEILPEIHKAYLKEFEGETPKQTVARRIAAFDPTEMLNYYVRQYIQDEVLLARRILGEPENFDYLNAL